MEGSLIGCAQPHGIYDKRLSWKRGQTQKSKPYTNWSLNRERERERAGILSSLTQAGRKDCIVGEEEEDEAASRVAVCGIWAATLLDGEMLPFGCLLSGLVLGLIFIVLRFDLPIPRYLNYRFPMLSIWIELPSSTSAIICYTDLYMRRAIFHLSCLWKLIWFCFWVIYIDGGPYFSHQE